MGLNLGAYLYAGQRGSSSRTTGLPKVEPYGLKMARKSLNLIGIGVVLTTYPGFESFERYVCSKNMVQSPMWLDTD